jgi:hypothetical protein
MTNDDSEEDDWELDDRLTCNSFRDPSAKRSVVALTASLRRSKLRDAVKRRLGELISNLSLPEDKENSLIDAIADEYADWYFRGACAEAEKIDAAVEALDPYPYADRSGLRWYGQAVGLVCQRSIDLMRESVRDDPAHKGRMGQRNDAILSAIQNAAEAWNRRAED